MLADAPPAALIKMAEEDEIPEGASPTPPSLLEPLATCLAALLDAAGPALAAPEHAAEQEALMAAFSEEAVAALHELVNGIYIYVYICMYLYLIYIHSFIYRRARARGGTGGATGCLFGGGGRRPARAR